MQGHYPELNTNYARDKMVEQYHREEKRPYIERIILLPYNGDNHIFTNCENSDARAIKEAVYQLEKREGKIKGSIKINLDDVLIKLK